MRSWMALAIGLLVLAGCAHRPRPPEWQLGRYSFNYEVEKPEATGLVQVFNDGEFTYLQFADREAAAKTIRFIDPTSERALKVVWLDAYAKLSGVPPRLFVEQRVVGKKARAPRRSSVCLSEDKKIRNVSVAPNPGVQNVDTCE